MQKIASPQELQTELRRLLAQCEGTELPSRVVLSAELRGLADRVSSEKQASGEDLIDFVISQREMMKLHQRLGKEDEQSAQLMVDVYEKLNEKMTLDTGASEALRRLKTVVDRGQTWDADMLRNNIFKAAHALGLKLPSFSF